MFVTIKLKALLQKLASCNFPVQFSVIFVKQHITKNLLSW